MFWVPDTLQLSVDEVSQLSVVWACVDAIAKAVASSPVNVFAIEGRRRVSLPDDTLWKLLNQRPNPETTAIAWREAMLYGALTHGNAYSEIVRDNAGRVQALMPLLPDRMRVTRHSETSELVYEYQDFNGSQKFLTPREVFHLRGPSATGLMGDSIVAKASKAAALAAAAERFALSYLANGSVGSGTLEHPGKISDDDLKRIRAQWEERYAGPKNSGRPFILENGMTWKPIAADPDKAQLIPTQQWTVEAIARYFGVPLVKLGVQQAAQGYGTNVEQLNLEWVRTGLRPWALRFEQEANAKLFPPRGPYREIVVDMEWLTWGDAKSRAEADAIRVRSGVFSVNDVLERMGQNTIGPEGDIRLVEAALTPLTTSLLDIQELAAKEPEPVTAPAATDAPAEAETDPAAEDVGEAALMRRAFTAMFGRGLARHTKRLEARRADLRRSKVDGEQLTVRLREARDEYLPKLKDDVSAGLEVVQQATGLNGEVEAWLIDAAEEAWATGQPDRAAERLIAKYLEGRRS